MPGGFRAPQAFDEDLHISVAGGKRIRIRLADNLKEERSHSFSTSADWYHTFGTVSLNLMAEGFLTVLKDTYALRETGEKADGGKSNIMERYNGSGAKVYGCTLEGRLAVANELSLQAGVTLQRSRYDIAQKWSDDPDVAPTQELFRSPDCYGYMVASYSPFRNFDIDLSGTYTGSMLTQHMAGSGTKVDVAVRTPSFWDMGCQDQLRVQRPGHLSSKVARRSQEHPQCLPEGLRQGGEKRLGLHLRPVPPAFTGLRRRTELLKVSVGVEDLGIVIRGGIAGHYEAFGNLRVGGQSAILVDPETVRHLAVLGKIFKIRVAPKERYPPSSDIAKQSQCLTRDS